MTDTTGGGPEVGEPPAPATSPGSTPLPPAWTRTLTRLVYLTWGTCELALWGARPQALSFIALMIMGTEGATAVAKVGRLLR